MKDIEIRKKEHLDLALDERSGDTGSFSTTPCGNGLDAVHLPYDALFEVSDSELDTSTQMACFPLAFPWMIGAMTGGVSFASPINTAFRALAKDFGIAICLGSMRAALEDETVIFTYGLGGGEAVFANIGWAEIERFRPENVSRICDKMGANGIFIHLNVLQEWMQPGGERQLSVRFKALKDFIDAMDRPVFLKEVGSGIGGKCAQRLCELAIAGIETAGRGGTSWIKLEALRRQPPLDDGFVASLAQLGYRTGDILPRLRRDLGDRTLIASGGIHTPIDLIKSLALGADLAATAQPIYRVYAQSGRDGLATWMAQFIEVAKLIWRSTGAKNLYALKNINTAESPA